MFVEVLCTFDVNNSRTLEFGELRSLLVALNKREPVSDWEVRAVLKAADKDRTGDISLEEMKGVSSRAWHVLGVCSRCRAEGFAGYVLRWIRG